LQRTSLFLRFKFWLRLRILGIIGSILIGATVGGLLYLSNKNVVGSIVLGVAIAFTVYVVLEVFDILEDSQEGFMQ
jgi:hypothetical protein